MPSEPPLIDVQIVDHPVSYQSFDGLGMEAGGECAFLGRTRRDVHPRHGPLSVLSYDAYRPLACSTLGELAAEACKRFGCRAVRIHHALGAVAPGEASVLVQVICAHRGEAFEACRFLIDRLKEKAPIWKRETWADGASWADGTTVVR